MQVTFRPVGVVVPAATLIGEVIAPGSAAPTPFTAGETFTVAASGGDGPHDAVRADGRRIGDPVDPDRVARPDDPSARGSDESSLSIRLHRTAGHDRPAPFEPDDFTVWHVGEHGPVAREPTGFARVGDAAAYDIEITGPTGPGGPTGRRVCRYEMALAPRTDEATTDTTVPWWKWPLAVALLPIALPVWATGGLR